MNIKKLKVIRVGLKMSLSDISRKTGIDKGRLSLIENGKANPTIGTLEKIAAVLDAKIEIVV